ncbi:MAG: hypothetical protein DMF98_23400, partial [Acidobacteria bacterium]
MRPVITKTRRDTKNTRRDNRSKDNVTIERRRREGRNLQDFFAAFAAFAFHGGVSWSGPLPRTLRLRERPSGEPSLPDVSIIIVSFNARADLERCLGSLHASVQARSWEIIVVDNGSSDGSADAAARTPGVQVICNRDNLGFARATNIGIRASQGTNLLLLNSDTVVPSGAIERLLDILDLHPDVAVVGPRLIDAAGKA